jgi:prophage DNA circulation protein
MEPGKWALEEALAAIESETRHLVHTEAPPAPTAETDVDIAPLVQKVGATAIVEIEKMIGELQEARDFLQSEGERVQRETERYTNLTQMASASVKIISDTVAGWREAGHPLRNQPRSDEMEVTPYPAEDVTGSLRVPEQQSPQSQGQIRARSRGKEPLK